MKLGKVFLVGAGPGDPGLITVKGLEALRGADVVLYDRLVHPDLLKEAPPWAELIDVGKEPNGHAVPQELVHGWMLAKAQDGQTVVRLKGGDPFVFGRGSEEALALAEAGIPWEVIPGVSSAIAAPEAAGIPVTHRGISHSFLVITGHRCDGSSALEAARPYVPGRTLVVLMGLARLPRIAEELVAAGWPPEIPAAIISRGTLEEQKVVLGTLNDISLRASEVVSPATIVVGETVALARRLGTVKALVESLQMTTPEVSR